MIPGKPKPFLGEKENLLAGSISEKTYVNINGVRQGMFIKSKDAAHPVLLFPAWSYPRVFSYTKVSYGLEEYFIVVRWEQRGLGLSNSAIIPPEPMMLEQIISDTKEMTNYLRKRFGQEKIFLMAHSGGTFIGLQVAARVPELYHSYSCIGVAQLTNQIKSESLAYEYTLEQFKEKGNKKMVRKFEPAPVTLMHDVSGSYLSSRDEAMHSLGIGTSRNIKSVITGIFLPSLTCK